MKQNLKTTNNQTQHPYCWLVGKCAVTQCAKLGPVTKCNTKQTNQKIRTALLTPLKDNSSNTLPEWFISKKVVVKAFSWTNEQQKQLKTETK